MLLRQSDWSDTAVILLWIHDCHPSHSQKEGTHSQRAQLSLPSLGYERHWYSQGSRNSEERRKKERKKDKWYHMYVKKNCKKKNLGYFNHISVISVACLLCMRDIGTVRIVGTLKRVEIAVEFSTFQWCSMWLILPHLLQFGLKCSWEASPFC